MKYKTIPATLIFFFVASCIIYIYAPKEGHIEVDTTEYQTVAQTFIAHKRFFDPRQEDGMPLHPIGYACVLGVAGLITPDPIMLIVILQILATMLSIYLLFLSTTELFNTSVGYISAILAACNTGYLTYAQILLTESLLLLALTCFIYLFVRYIKGSSYIFLCTAGITLSISVLVKPNALFFPLFITIFLIYKFSRKPLIGMGHICLFGISYGIPLILYTLYNFYAFKKLMLTGTMHENIYHYFIPRYVMHLLEASEQTAITKFIQENNFTRNSVSLFLDLCIKYPLIIFKAWFTNIAKTLLGLYATQFKVLFNPLIRGGACSYFKMEGLGLAKYFNYILFGSNSIHITLIALLETVVVPLQLACTLVATYLLYQRNKLQELTFIYGYIIYFIFITGHDGCSRYRLPAEPMLIIVTGLAIYELYQGICKKKNQRVDWQENRLIDNSEGSYG